MGENEIVYIEMNKNKKRRVNIFAKKAKEQGWGKRFGPRVVNGKLVNPIGFD